MKITGFTAWLVEHEPGPKFIWRDGLHGSHGDIPRGTKPRKAVIRMETDAGLYRRHGDQPRRRRDRPCPPPLSRVHRRESAAHRAHVADDLGDRPRRGNPHAGARHARHPLLGREIAAREDADLPDARRRRPRGAGLCLDGHLADDGRVRALHQDEPRPRLQGVQAPRLGRREARHRALDQSAEVGRATTPT